MHVYRVGELYSPNRTSWPERAEYNWRANTHELRLFYANIKPAEVKAITRGPAQFGAWFESPVLFFLFRFQSDQAWSDCPYSWHLLKARYPDEATIPPLLEEQEQVLLQVVLVEAATGIIKGLRVVSLSINLSRYLHTAIRAQIETPFDVAEYDRALERIYRTHTTDAIVQRAEKMKVS